MYTLFISDVHLSSQNPEIADVLLQLLARKSPDADAIYMLGDMFEYWLGDDAINEEHHAFLQTIRRISEEGTPVYYMHGNRDFLVGEKFAQLCDCTILEDPCVIDLYGMPTLLTHGDLLCTDDTEYQIFRQTVRNPAWQSQFLNLSITERLALAKKARDASKAKTGEYMQSAEEIMDANQQTVEHFMSQANVRQMIHGHTHRPHVHHFVVNSQPMTRIVLGDWCPEPSYLIVGKDQIELHDRRWHLA